jgi:hypothetical protein
VSTPDASALRPTLATALLAVLLAGCGPEPVEPEPSEPTLPPRLRLETAVAESWVKPESWRGYWTIYADVRDSVGEQRWAALDTAWMAERARADLATVTVEDDYDDEFILSGLWRLGMLRAEVLEVFARREPEAAWPLFTPDRRLGVGWRPRIARWFRARPADERKAALAEKLQETWKQAVAAADLKLAARVLEVRQTLLGEEAAPADLRPTVEKMVREYLGVYLREYEKDWRDGRPRIGVIRLMEWFGVPDGVDLDAVVAAAQHYYRETFGAVIPLPHPYGLNIRVQRLQRLQAGAGD